MSAKNTKLNSFVKKIEPKLQGINSSSSSDNSQDSQSSDSGNVTVNQSGSSNAVQTGQSAHGANISKPSSDPYTGKFASPDLKSQMSTNSDHLYYKKVRMLY